MSGDAIDVFQKEMFGEIVSIFAEKMADDGKALLGPALNYLHRCISEDVAHFKGMYLKHNGGRPTVRVLIQDPDTLLEIVEGPPVPVIEMIVASMKEDADHHKWKFYSEFTQQLRDALGLKDSA